MTDGDGVNDGVTEKVGDVVYVGDTVVVVEGVGVGDGDGLISQM